MAVSPKERRDEMRTKIFASRKPMSEPVTFFGEDIEIRQPNVRTILALSSDDAEGLSSVKMFIGYAYIPGTDIKVFDDEDLEGLTNMPFNEDWMAVNTAIAKMTGVDVGVKEEGKNSD